MSDTREALIAEIDATISRAKPWFDDTLLKQLRRYLTTENSAPQADTRIAEAEYTRGWDAGARVASESARIAGMEAAAKICDSMCHRTNDGAWTCGKAIRAAIAADQRPKDEK